MSVETQHSDDSSTDIENYEWFTDEHGCKHYRTPNHHVIVTDDETNFVHLNKRTDDATECSIYFDSVQYKHRDNDLIDTSFVFSLEESTTATIKQADVSIEFEELLFEVLIHE